MASDASFEGGTRVPFHTLETTADASGNGVEVVAAPTVATKNHYVMGWMVQNKKGAAIIVTLYHTAGAAGKTQISAGLSFAADGTLSVNYHEPLAVGAGKNLGVVASAAGDIEVEIWGYTR